MKTTYEVKNYALLQELHHLLMAFPFQTEDEKILKQLDLDAIQKEYLPYSDLEVDPVANAIIWSASVLQSLMERRPVKTLDEVRSFVNSVLSEK